jgi:hypothetical protein
MCVTRGDSACMEPHTIDGVMLMQMTIHTYGIRRLHELTKNAIMQMVLHPLLMLAARRCLQHTACNPWKVTRFMMFQHALDLDEQCHIRWVCM